jgi:pullulanase/glycogen debranching enzyme
MNGVTMTGPIEEGLPYPLGAHWNGQGTNFALFSANAAKVEVCLFDGDTPIRYFTATSRGASAPAFAARRCDPHVS